MKELLIDTCNKTLSISLTDNNQLVTHQVLNGFKNHAETLMVVIDQLMANIKWQPQDLDSISVTNGPGSYTGIRIGVTCAKTLGYTLDIPVKCVSSLELLSYNLNYLNDTLIVPLINARRNNLYAGVYLAQNNKITNLISDKFYSEQELYDILQKYDDKQVYLLGDTQEFNLLNNKYLCIDDNINNIPNAYYLTKCKGTVYQGEDIHQIVPNYLKTVEAEENWQKDHPNIAQKDSYIELIK